MIFIKNKIKRIFSLLAVALIIVTSLPIGVSAADTPQSVQVNFGFDSHLYDDYVNEPEEVTAAMMSLTFEFIDSNNNDRTYDYNGTSFSTAVYAYEGYDWHIKITNPSYYEFRFELVVPGGVSLGIRSIPAATSAGPGVFEFSLNTLFTYDSSATKLTFWLRTSDLLPIDKNYNDNAAVIYFHTPDGIHSNQLVFAPSETIGIYTYDFDDLISQGLIDLPNVLDGYLLDSSTVPDVVKVNPDVVMRYDIYYVDKVNSGFISFYAQLPGGQVVPLGQVTPPDTHVGAYTFVYADAMRSFVLDDYAVEALEGYEINYSLFDINTSYIIYNDTMDEIFIPYQVAESSARTLRFELYDVYGTFLEAKIVKVANSALTCNTPIYKEYDTFPYSVDVDVTLPLDQVQVFQCYAVDVAGSMKENYDRGYKDGLAFGQASSPNVGDAWKEGYDEGLADGLSQNKLTAEQIQQYTKDYNAVTAFFDGMFSWIKNMFFGIGEGIQFRGISALDIVSSIIIIAVVIWGYKTLF